MEAERFEREAVFHLLLPVASRNKLRKVDRNRCVCKHMVDLRIMQLTYDYHCPKYAHKTGKLHRRRYGGRNRSTELQIM